MKFNLLIAALSAITFFSACTKNDTGAKADKTGPDVYLSGYLDDGHAVYWKNGIQVRLGYAINTTGIAIAGNDVYVAGNVGSNSPVGGLNLPVYWKNGELVKLNNISGITTGIAISGTDVYIAGRLLKDDGAFYGYWKNGLPVVVDSVPNSNSFLRAIAISGSDVYLAGSGGSDGTLASYWKNGKETLLENSDSSAANAIAITGNDVYVAGYYTTATGLKAAAFWKNGLRIPLTDPTVTPSVATSIAIDGMDVYVAGRVNNGDAVYWKNAVQTFVRKDQQYHPYQEQPVNNVLIAAGNIYISLSSADYWKNGEITHLGQGYVNSIAIIPQ